MFTIASSKHLRSWKNSSQLYKPEMQSRVFITVSNSSNSLPVQMRLCKHGPGKSPLLLNYHSEILYKYCTMYEAITMLLSLAPFSFISEELVWIIIHPKSLKKKGIILVNLAFKATLYAGCISQSFSRSYHLSTAFSFHLCNSRLPQIWCYSILLPSTPANLYSK